MSFIIITIWKNPPPPPPPPPPPLLSSFSGGRGRRTRSCDDNTTHANDLFRSIDTFVGRHTSDKLFRTRLCSLRSGFSSAWFRVQRCLTTRYLAPLDLWMRND
ncbi:hypothetical protein BC938DRAFT_470580 [Jimgerdemannia flammicorona]|uniref:Uncharacterized protein n=1 Tax=Jimgerdemannia flammicorona TaxID=994334 RepID=A0A433Q9W2_9FUNG|nr:hypothetical protein BC938DRAFT_470580 [Jimgerdemannia flammicorona]